MFVYILHFQSNLAHAEHYVGSTSCLEQRLKAHATLSGARLTKRIAEVGIQWQLGGLFQATTRSARSLERSIKKAKNSPKFCTLCNPLPRSLPGAKSYPLASVPFPLASKNYNQNTAPFIEISEREDDLERAVSYLINQQKLHKVELGFIPTSGLKDAIERKRCIWAKINGALAGFLLYTIDPARQKVTIHQLCVQEEYQQLGCGRALVEAVQIHYPNTPATCRVLESIPAFDFWRAIGWNYIRTIKHKTSGHKLAVFNSPFPLHQERKD